MIDVRVQRNFPPNCIKLIIVVWAAWSPVFCLPVLGMAELLEVLEDNLLSSPSLLVSQAWSELLVFLSRDSSLPALTLSQRPARHVFSPLRSSNFSRLLV